MAEKYEDIIKKLNPAMIASKTGPAGCASMGDKYADRLLKALNEPLFSYNLAPALHDTEQREIFAKIIKNIGAAVWLRHTAADRLFKALRMNAFADLGCGMDPRGLAFTEKKTEKYIGIDLPPIINKMDSAVIKATGSVMHRNRVSYIAADVTDYNALRSALNVKEPLFILTESLMMYLTENELKTVIGNIYKLLAEYSGVWVTADFGTSKRDKLLTENATNGYDPQKCKAVTEPLIALHSGTITNNSFMRLGGDDVSALLKQSGFTVRKIAMETFVGELDIPENVKRVCEKDCFLAMTVSEPEFDAGGSTSGSRFNVSSASKNNDATLWVSGRLDAVTAPQLIEEFEKCRSMNRLRTVTLNMTACTYISSAGIRALLMIYKAAEKDGFKFRTANLTPDVLEILRTTGFNDLG